jgi:phosphoglycolate phosphatase
VEGAIRHNLRCVGVTWGYGTQEELSEAGAAAIAHQPHDLLSILQTHAVS